MTLEYGVNSDVGCLREHNEDAYLVDAQSGLWLVADGMGGHEAGEVASEIARKTVSECIKSGRTLQDSIQRAHHAIKEAVENGEGSPGMGSTIVALRVNGTHYEVAWVGDSRAYLWNGQLKRLSNDHSYVQGLLDSGAINEEEARKHPKRSLITQALGSTQVTDVQVDIVTGILYRGQKILLCSDGLTEEVTDAAISEILASDGRDQVLVDRMISAAISGGGSDNITVILVSAPDYAQEMEASPDAALASQERPWRLKFLAIGMGVVILIAIVIFVTFFVKSHI